jgi:hypothetical protein
MRQLTPSVAVLLLVFARVAGADVLLFDDFNAENAGVRQLNYTAFANWDITDGSVDLCDAVDVMEGDGLYVDLDGSTDDAGRMESKTTFPLQPGSYELSFLLAGSQRGDFNTVTVSLGDAYSETFALASSVPWTSVKRTIIVPTATDAKLVFDHAGGDTYGILLDNVAFVPEPSTLVLLGVGALALTIGWWRRRRAA